MDLFWSSRSPHHPLETMPDARGDHVEQRPGDVAATGQSRFQIGDEVVEAAVDHNIARGRDVIFGEALTASPKGSKTRKRS